ncbi:hypothetical protein HYU10_04645 [Candidatus Woesearchaeota archaeon]|nr:hypothetical protein [Candidatus Woesearchaeota archaeon]MBI2131030.1 hypothetical protein [Candidatus Woesearchaeota archaeon]MBI2661280.1 hypothetical protein [Candidatus Woesearchaeota archaeon]
MKIDELARMMGVSRRDIERILNSSDVIELNLNERGGKMTAENDDEDFIRVV